MFELKGDIYLILIDYASNYPEVVNLRGRKDSSIVIDKMKTFFSHFGIPEILVADNNPFNSKEMHDFAKLWGFEIKPSSPGYPKSNGLAEKGVQICKRILKKANDLTLGLLEYRNTPLPALRMSPNEIVFGRSTRTKLPISINKLKSNNYNEVYDKKLLNKGKQQGYYNRTAQSVKSCKPGQVG